MGKKKPEAGSEDQHDELGFDEILSGLQGVVEKLEAGQVNLESALSAYEEGIKLAKRGHTLLDQAESRIELLVSAGSDGIVTEPLDS